MRQEERKDSKGKDQERGVFPFLLNVQYRFQKRFQSFTRPMNRNGFEWDPDYVLCHQKINQSFTAIKFLSKSECTYNMYLPP